MSLQQKTFFRYIHNFRGLAILLIVLGHTTVFLDLKNYPITLYTKQVFLGNGSVYFVFIAGFLFQFLSKKYVYTSYLSKKFFNVILPYLIVSIPALAFCLLKNKPFYDTTWVNDSFTDWSIVQKIAILLLTGTHFFHFWFIPMISIFYIFAPVFIWIDRNPKLYGLLPLLVALSIAIPRPGDDAQILQNFVHFTSVYVLGMFCCHYRDRVLEFMKHRWHTVMVLEIVLAAIQIILRVTDTPLQNTLNFNTASKSILSILFMYLLWQYDAVASNRFHLVMGSLADLSFGIYFIHAYVIFLYLRLLEFLNITSSMHIVSVAFMTFLAMIITVGILLVSKRYLGKRSRYLVGC